MTQATTLRFGAFLVKLGDGGSPEVFSAPCGLNSRAFNRAAATNTTNVPDCADPDAPSWDERDVTSLSSSLDGAGVVADEDFDVWNTWFESGLTKNVQITLGTRTWIGPYKLTTLNVTGARGSRTTLTVKIDNDGETILQ